MVRRIGRLPSLGSARPGQASGIGCRAKLLGAGLGGGCGCEAAGGSPDQRRDLADDGQASRWAAGDDGRGPLAASSRRREFVDLCDYDVTGRGTGTAGSALAGEADGVDCRVVLGSRDDAFDVDAFPCQERLLTRLPVQALKYTRLQLRGFDSDRRFGRGSKRIVVDQAWPVRSGRLRATDSGSTNFGDSVRWAFAFLPHTAHRQAACA